MGYQSSVSNSAKPDLLISEIWVERVTRERNDRTSEAIERFERLSLTACMKLHVAEVVSVKG